MFAYSAYYPAKTAKRLIESGETAVMTLASHFEIMTAQSFVGAFR